MMWPMKCNGRPLQTMWASGLLAVGGGFFLIPLTATFIFGVIWGLAPDSLSLILIITSVGLAQIGTALAAWRGMAWSRWFALCLVAANLVGLIVGYYFLALGILIAGSAAILLWRPAARRWSASVMHARR